MFPIFLLSEIAFFLPIDQLQLSAVKYFLLLAAAHNNSIALC